MRTVITRALQAVVAIGLAVAGLMVPAGTASATTGGGWVWLNQATSAGIYVDPGTNAPKNPQWSNTDIPAGTGSGVSANCWDYGNGNPVPGYADTWYHVSGEYYGNLGQYHSYTGWVYAPFVDGQGATGWLPKCSDNGQWFWVNGPNNVGEYDCPSSGCGKNSTDVVWMNTGSAVFAQCYSRGQNITGSDLWFNISYEYQNNGGYQQRHSAWVYAPFMGVTGPGSVAPCPIGNYVY
ncbi:hypothetical protein [Kitasatospora aureofaciens]|uniref:hypothetical protein n=1 Tax=Kitasatospora aureofaciens TaxID=1894 RepID=UPI001C4533F3|nr:hypothetical protein [Kitasatospora aureofaciens]MBV6702658.1 hypothetical protein [Kitasatospora aureofaciens]